MTRSLSETAVDYIQAGLSILPCKHDKRPAVESWVEYQKRTVTAEEAKEWFRTGNKKIALICGSVSGNLEVIDFDCQADALPAWTRIVQEMDSTLISKLIIERSPAGAHTVYRCVDPIPANTKLARKKIKVSGPGEHAYRGKSFQSQKIRNDYFITPEIIETRGEGGYCIVSPSPGYVLKQGLLTALPVLTAEERQTLIDAARACNEAVDERTIERGYKKSDEELKPGQDYDARGDIRALLQKHGWTSKGNAQDGRERWQRPGKNGNAYSATLTDGKIFYPFSSNAMPFESGRAYGPFAVYATLEHSGDFSQAAKALQAQGYGTQGQEQKASPKRDSAPSMGDLREYLDLCVVPGQKITADEICRGLSCYKREERKAIYTYLGRLCKDKEGILLKDDYHHGGYRRAVEIESFDLGGTVSEDERFYPVKLPLDLENFINMKPDQLFQVSGRYDAGKSTFLFQIMADNYQDNKIIHIISDEWDRNAIKERMDILGIPRPHPNIKSYPMRPGYEDLIPSGPCIVLIDYVRADQNPFETDAQIQRILRNLDGGIAIFATQKHPGLDRPVGGQFAVHASHHIIMLDRWKEVFICKIYRTKSKRNLEGCYQIFKISEVKRVFPLMADWKKGKIKWEKESKTNDNNDNIFDVSKPGPPPVRKERKKERIYYSKQSA